MPSSYGWFKRSPPRTKISGRMICCPHAGAGASSFARWAVEAPDGLDFYSLQLPGREDATHLQPPADLGAVVFDLTSAIAAFSGDGTPLVLYGHSLGAALAYQLALDLARSGEARPVGLLVSGRRAPHLPRRRPALHELADDDLVIKLSEAGGNNAFWSKPHLRRRYLDLVRNDLAALERIPLAAEGSLAIPIVVFHGMRDPWVSQDESAAWANATRSSFKLRCHDGGHFDHHSVRHAIMSEATTLCRFDREHAA